MFPPSLLFPHLMVAVVTLCASADQLCASADQLCASADQLYASAVELFGTALQRFGGVYLAFSKRCRNCLVWIPEKGGY